MNDQYTETTSESWFGRLGNSIKGILFGLLLFVLAFPLLFWNEGRAIKTYRALKEGEGKVISIDAQTVSPENNGQLVHLIGTAETTDTLQDPDFGVSQTALRLLRDVEMYQWKEKESSTSKKKLGGGKETKTTYSYSKTWSNKVIDSSSFKKSEEHQNPDVMEFEKQEFTAADVSLGQFRLPQHLTKKIDAFQQLPVKNDTLTEELQERVKEFKKGFYIGENPSQPAIGDLRITFKYVPNTEISLIAKQLQNTFENYNTSNGRSLLMLKTGAHSAENMFAAAHSSNSFLTWALRIGGLFLMFFGLSLVFKPLSVLADVVPFVGSLVGMGTAFIAFAIAAILSFITIAVAWFAYRPLLSIGLLVLAAGLMYWIKMKKDKVSPQAPVQGTA